jgi:DNA-directed RNA polymerase specialized sigma24 family protein
MLECASLQVRAEVRPETQSVQRRKQVRLSQEQQAELDQRYEAGGSKKELARIYGIHVETVRAIIRRRSQAH